MRAAGRLIHSEGGWVGAGARLRRWSLLRPAGIGGGARHCTAGPRRFTSQPFVARVLEAAGATCRHQKLSCFANHSSGRGQPQPPTQTTKISKVQNFVSAIVCRTSNTCFGISPVGSGKITGAVVARRFAEKPFLPLCRQSFPSPARDRSESRCVLCREPHASLVRTREQPADARRLRLRACVGCGIGGCQRPAPVEQ
jgi:hypothetical protein